MNTAKRLAPQLLSSNHAVRSTCSPAIIIIIRRRRRRRKYVSTIPGNHELRNHKKLPYWALHTYFGKF
jgi:translation initiation factor 1 (eIF-1/SUI1)